MIEKYSEGLETSLESTSIAEDTVKAVVLLTGSTGNLAVQILSLLLQNRSVHRVHTLNRPSTRASLLDRHKERFLDKELDISLLDTDMDVIRLRPDIQACAKRVGLVGERVCRA